MGLVGDWCRLILQHLVEQDEDDREEQEAKEYATPEIRLPVRNSSLDGNNPGQSSQEAEQRGNGLNEGQPPRDLFLSGIPRRTGRQFVERLAGTGTVLRIADPSGVLVLVYLSDDRHSDRRQNTENDENSDP